ncbi:Not1 N-terminal domain, CCR4-Not complex component-domain-containing protein [Lipomyces oligophaga]|uniref:Not1 N-terminal domain, CCR4-Not complex component-domain-containing protein n=1 Tax=Lipomyces oligophaga TaxID=45792 RepID=UPI0034CEFD08
MAQRKLQQEIDRVFKRIAEGVQAFDALYDKVMTTSNQSQKEKLEQDLKREIKKLQRLRDQIKTWLGSNDIKDKKALSDQRRLIETQMERFKACEKEMKTKAYSREGLTASLRLDPKEKEKQEMGHFIQSMIEDLDRQTEQLEAEQETLQASAKRGKKDSAKASRISEIEYRIEQHKWHQGKLEVILRLLENGNLEVDQVSDIQEDIKFYVEANQDVDFADDEELYESLNLDEEEEKLGMGELDHTATSDTPGGHEDIEERAEPAVAASPLPSAPVVTSTSVPTTTTTTAKRPETTARKSSAKSPTVGSTIPLSTAPVPPAAIGATRATTATSVPNVSTNSVAGTNGVLSSMTGGPTMKPAVIPARPAGEGLKYASAAAAAAAATPGLSPLPPPPSPAAVNKVVAEKSSGGGILSAQSNRGPGSSAASSPALSVATVASSTTVQTGSDETKPTDISGPAYNTGPNAATAGSIDVDERDTAQKGSFDMKEIEAELNSTTNSTTNKDEDSNAGPIEGLMKRVPEGLQDLVLSFEAAKKRVERPPLMEGISKYLEASLAHCPEASDSEKPRHYQPKTPFPTSPYFPQELLPIFQDPVLYEKVDIDTLFYVFYYRQGTYEQALAAKELKKQSWRFHKKFLTWFQRHEEPKIITDDYEQGTYRYFDFESTWLQRRKANFEFEYQYLEDEIV